MMTKRIVVLLTAAYALALIVYLVLRFALRDTLWWLAFLHNFAPYYFAPLLVLIPLLFIVRARGTAVRLLPLLLIGLLLFGPRWLPKPVVNAAGDTPSIKLVTFNVLVLTEDYERITAWLRATDADVILLQEVDDAETPVIIEALADAYPYQVDLIGTTLLALSRYPIREAALVDLGAWFIDRFVLEVEGQALAVYNMHMHLPLLNEPRAGFPAPGGMAQLALQYDEFHRNRLIHRLLELLAEEDLPYIVAGDFNTSDNALIYDEMAAVMRDSFRETNIGLAQHGLPPPGMTRCRESFRRCCALIMSGTAPTCVRWRPKSALIWVPIICRWRRRWGLGRVCRDAPCSVRWLGGTNDGYRTS